MRHGQPGHPVGGRGWGLVVLLVVCLLAAACGGGDSSDEERAAQAEIATLASEALDALDEAVAVSGEQLQEAAEQVSEAVQEGQLGLATPGVLVVGTNADFLPFVGRGEDDGIRGFDVDLMTEVASRMGLEPVWVDMPFPNLTGAVTTGEVDVVIAAITITNQREEVIDFSHPYFVGSQGLAAPPGSDLTGVEDLSSDVTVAVLADTTGEAYATESFLDAEIASYADRATALGALSAGAVDAIFMDTDALVEQAREGSVVLVEEVPTSERYGIGLAEDNAPLRTAVNEALDGVVADGTYQRIFTEWFPGRDVEQVIDLLR